MPFAATSWISGVSPFAIPVEVESTITEDPGQPALVENVSENPNLVALRFYVPRGDDGADGAPGPPGTPGAPGAAASISIGTVSALQYGSAPVVTNSGTSSAAVLDWQLVTGPQGPAGSSSSVLEYQFQTATTTPPTNGHIRIDNVDPSLSNSMYVSHIDGAGVDQDYILQLVPPSATLVLQKKGDSTIAYTYSVIVTLSLTGYVRYETIFVSSSGTLANNDQVVLVIVNSSPPGEAATVNVGTVMQVAYPGPITVTNSGTTSAAILDFQLCPGPAGTDGTAATVAVGTVTTGAPGSSVTVVNSGTSSAAVLDFSIPQGATGSGSSITITNTSTSIAYRLLFTNTASGSAATFLNTIASALTYNPSTLALTNTGGSISCASVTATNFTGTASTASAVTTVSTTTLSDRYILFTNTVGASATVNVASALDNQLKWNAGSVTMTIGNAAGILNVNTINCPNLSGTASVATAVTIANTQSTSERFLCFATGAGNTGVFLNSASASKIACVPGTPSITMGSGVGGTGVITCNSFVGALTGNASSATATAITATSVASPRYLVFTPDTTGNASMFVSPTLATQIYVQPSIPSLVLGNGITGTGLITCATVTCTTLNGQATGADTVETIATSTNATRYLLFTPSNNSTAANAAVQSAVALTYNPGTALLTATNLTVSGTLTATVSTATNLAGGAAGSIPYQSAAGASSFLGISTAGQILRSTGTAPSWAAPGGFSVSFGGNASAAGMVLQYGLPSALFATTALNSTLNLPANGFVTPYAGILTAAAAYSTTSSATATATIHVNGAAALTTIAAGQFSSTGARALTLSSTTATIAAGSLVEVRVNVAAIGNCQITLYLA